MYDHLQGILVELTEQEAVIQVHGLGFRVFVPQSFVLSRPSVGSTITLYVAFVVREQAHSLFGFIEKQERQLFETLIGLSGIGPKTALSLIGHLGIQGMQEAVRLGHIHPFVKVPGIGKKTAERLLIDLKGKVEGFITVSASCRPSCYQEALQALLNLGYAEAAAHKALTLAQKEEGSSATVESFLTAALKLSKTLT